MKQRMEQDFGFDGSRDLNFRKWNNTYFASYQEIGPLMSTHDAMIFTRICKASASGQKKLPFPTNA